MVMKMNLRAKFPRTFKFLLLLGDLFWICFGAYLPFLLLLDQQTLSRDLSIYYEILPLLLISSGILLNINNMLSLVRKEFGQIFVGLLVFVFELYIVVMASNFFFRFFTYPRSVLLMAMLLQYILLAGWNFFCWRLEKKCVVPKNVLIVGNDDLCEAVISRIRMLTSLNYHTKFTCEKFSHMVTERSNDLIDLIIVMPGVELKSKDEILHYCQARGKQVMLVPDVYELFCYGIELDQIDDIPVFRAKYLKPTFERRVVKRGFDLLVAGIGLLILWPLFLAAALAVKATSRGPVLYSQIRVGRDEEEFRVYKFRSMVQNAEATTGPVLAAKNDTRITPVGRFLRATRLDELPQLFNVIKGDMSIVGPRPERPVFVEQFKKEIPGYGYRHNVKPGITGMAQVYGKYNTTARDKLIYDLIYIQNCSVITDLTLIIQTIRVLVTKSSTAGVENNHGTVQVGEYQVHRL
ncbi:bacterial sugar transferase [Lucifera butyrica]|uniref:Bacterial sugar transferase n=2 Tax=Lucifera butyrica TaxID=1351585 RepID=A0A498RDJ8_9FIRM|nr:bacterial sugar transferase [Lucifera butyrica]